MNVCGLKDCLVSMLEVCVCSGEEKLTEGDGRGLFIGFLNSCLWGE
jgi:hypothetical protein